MAIQMSREAMISSSSSEASVEFYEERLKLAIDAIKKSSTPLLELVDVAERIISEKFALDPRSTFTVKQDFKEISSGKRYVASAIFACSKEEDVVEALAALGITWLTHFLFIFTASRDHGNQRNYQPSGSATPAIGGFVTHLLEGVGNRQGSFSDDVIARDGYRCVLTGVQDKLHPNPVEGIFKVRLVGVHILRRAIGEFDKDHNSKSFKSAVTTFDILLNLTRLSELVQTLDELHDHLDKPSNRMALQNDAYDAFDAFQWCLKPTETEHVYDLKIFKDEGILCKPENNRISFEDHSDDFCSVTTGKRKRTADLPDPCFIAIHAAVAGILHTSGAGRFFDELLKTYKDDEGNILGVGSLPELEALIEEQSLRESIHEGFNSVKVN